MVAADGALAALVVIAVGIFALAFPFVASGYHLYQGAQVLIFAVALLGLNVLTGFQWPDLPRPRRLLRHRRLRRRDPDHEIRAAVLGRDPAGQHRMFHRRLSVWLSRPQVRRALSCARHLRARGRSPADPELQGPRCVHRRLARHHARETPRPIWDRAHRRPVALPCLPRLRCGALLGCAQSRAEPDRAGAHRHSGSADRRRDDGD